MDAQSLLLLDQGGAGTVIKIRLNDSRTERNLDLKDFVGAGFLGISLSLAPDDSPLILREAGVQDI